MILGNSKTRFELMIAAMMRCHIVSKNFQTVIKVVCVICEQMKGAIYHIISNLKSSCCSPFLHFQPCNFTIKLCFETILTILYGKSFLLCKSAMELICFHAIGSVRCRELCCKVYGLSSKYELTSLLQVEYPKEWPSFFLDLITTLSDGPEAVDMFCRVLIAIDQDIVSREIAR